MPGYHEFDEYTLQSSNFSDAMIAIMTGIASNWANTTRQLCGWQPGSGFSKEGSVTATLADIYTVLHLGFTMQHFQLYYYTTCQGVRNAFFSVPIIYDCYHAKYPSNEQQGIRS